MKKITTILSIFLMLFSGFALANAESNGNGFGRGFGKGQSAQSEREKDKHTVDFSTYEKGTLTEEEKKAIIHMREEEKMARDVYRELSKTTDSRAFESIPVSENRHMDVFSQLIERYELEDPVKDESARGVFTDPAFAKLYKELTEKGKKSDKDAFEVGAIVEDINMANLIKYEKATDKKDLKLAYETLLEQSKHHMSAFVRNLERVGGSFSPQYVSAEELEKAVKSGQDHIAEEAKGGEKEAQEMWEEMEGKGHNKEMWEKHNGVKTNDDGDEKEGKKFFWYVLLGGLLIGLFLTKYFKKSKNKND